MGGAPRDDVRLGVLSGRPERYVIEIDRRDPLSGRVRDLAGASVYEFSGWLGIASVLERVLAERPDADRRTRAPLTEPPLT